MRHPPTIPTERQVARAVTRAESGKTLDASEVESLLAARDGLLERLMVVARRVRDAGLADVGRPGMVTYSPRSSFRSPGCVATDVTTARS